DYFAFFVKSQIIDNRLSKNDDSIADERLVLVYQNKNGDFHVTSPAKFLDLHAPTEFTKPVDPPPVVSNDAVVQWSYMNITQQQFVDTKAHAEKDAADRKKYLESAFTQVIMDLSQEIQEYQGKILLGDNKGIDKIAKKQHR